MILTHKIALDLTDEQEGYCRRAAGTARFTYNWALAEWKQQYNNGDKPTAAHLKTQWNAIKYARYPWLTAIPRDAHAKGMVHNHHLARAMSDMGFGMFRRMLTYKVDAAGVTLVLADRWFPSSKLCSQCGVLVESLLLSQRVFQCAHCGYQADRDVNAAINLHNYPGLQGK